MFQPTNTMQNRRIKGVKMAAIIVGILELLRTLIVLIANISIFALSNKASQQAEIFGLIVVILGTLAITVTVATMIFGIKRKRSLYLLPQMVMQAFVIAFYFYLFVSNLAYLAVNGDQLWFFAVFDMAVVVFEIVFAYLVVKCYKMMKLQECQEIALSFGAGGRPLPVQYIVPPPAYSVENFPMDSLQQQLGSDCNNGQSVYHPTVLNMAPPIYDTVVSNKPKFGTMVSSPNDKLYC